MNEKQWIRVKEVFSQAMGVPANERDDFLQRICSGDDALLANVQSLLRSFHDADDFMRDPTCGEGEGAAMSPVSSAVGSQIGPYKLLQHIGEGGFGSVYLAEQSAPVVRRVALKIIRPGMNSAQVIARFEAERQALAMMDHPNIARVLDAGATPEGLPFFVMELVNGRPITQFCEEHRLPLVARLELFVTVCHAVQHAHQKGVIHRDLKPSNVLVTLHDGKPVPKIIDFGIAKAISGAAPLTDKTLLTEFRQLIGTPEYMSPEQAEMSGAGGGSGDIDTRSDIYSLGVLLYEMLTGATPFERRRLRSAAFAEIQRIIREEEPPKPSTRLSGMSTAGAGTPNGSRRRSFFGNHASIGDGTAGPQADTARLARQVRGDLDWIVMKALEKDRTRRYATATEFAADVQRFLSHEPVLAGPPSAVYRLRKFALRNQGVVAATLGVLTALVVGVIGTSAGLRWALSERDRAEANHRRAEQSAARAQENEAQARRLAEFQSAMLRQLDAPTFGEKMRAEWASQVESSLRRRFTRGDDGKMRRLSDAEVVEGVERFLQVASVVNPADVARSLMDTAILAPAVAAIERDFTDQPAVEAALRQSVGSIYHSLGSYPAAEVQYRRALELRRAVLPSPHLEVAETLTHLVTNLHAQGKMAEAEPLVHEALAIRRALLDADHLLLAEAVNNVAVTLLGFGKFTEAEPLFKEALAMQRRKHGDDHSSLVMPLANLGSFYRNKGDFDEAERLLQEAVAICRIPDRPQNNFFGESLSALASIRQIRGDFTGAEQLYRESLAVHQKEFGDEHPAVMTVMNNLANILVEKGDNATAEAIFRDVLAMRRKWLGDAHVLVATTMNDLAVALSDQGDIEGAEALYRSALSILRENYGDQHIDVPPLLANLGLLMSDKGDYAAAMQDYRESLAMLRSLYGNENLQVATCLNGMAIALMRSGDFDSAEPYLQECLEIRRKLLGDDHPHTALATHTLGHLYLKRGDVAAAEPLLREALLKFRAAVGDEHPFVPATQITLAQMRSKAGDAAAAISFLEDALSIQRRMYGNNDPRIASTITFMADFMIQEGHSQQAEPLCREALKIRQTAFGDDAETTQETKWVLAMALVHLRNFAEAEDLGLDGYRRAVEQNPVNPWHLIRNLELLSALYERWHQAEPEQGLGDKAAEWRERFDAEKARQAGGNQQDPA